jgi:shikimate kinase
MNVILFGFKGAGKTFLGKQIAERYGWPFVDTDELLLSSSKYESLRGLYNAVGETEFRKLESQVVFSLQAYTQTVIALGGGAVLDPANVAFLQTIGQLVYLEAKLETLQARGVTLPSGELEKTYRQRLPIYESIFAQRIQTENYGIQ